MRAYLFKSKRALVYPCLAAGLALATGIGTELKAEEPSAKQIIEALTPKPLTRSLTLAPADSARKAEEAKFLDTLRNRPARSLTLPERKKLIEISQDKPNIDIDINFEYNSDRFAPGSMRLAKSLGEALSSPGLKGSTFVVEGHTDAKGSKKFNQKLSERRAEALKRFLVGEYRLPAANLMPSGYGETMLKNKDDPLAAENRRARVTNMTNDIAHK